MVDVGAPSPPIWSINAQKLGFRALMGSSARPRECAAAHQAAALLAPAAPTTRGSVFQGHAAQAATSNATVRTTGVAKTAPTASNAPSMPTAAGSGRSRSSVMEAMNVTTDDVHHPVRRAVMTQIPGDAPLIQRSVIAPQNEDVSAGKRSNTARKRSAVSRASAKTRAWSPAKKLGTSAVLAIEPISYARPSRGPAVLASTKTSLMNATTASVATPMRASLIVLIPAHRSAHRAAHQRVSAQTASMSMGAPPG